MAKGLPELWPPVSQDCFRKICCHTWGSRSFIWKAALRTANDQLKLDYFFPFVSQAAALAPLAHLRKEGKHRAKKVLRSFFSSQSLSSASPAAQSFSPSCASRHILGVYQSWRHGLSCLQSQRELCLWHLAKSFPLTYFRSRHSGSSLLRVVIWFIA